MDVDPRVYRCIHYTVYICACVYVCFFSYSVMEMNHVLSTFIQVYICLSVCNMYVYFQTQL